MRDDKFFERFDRILTNPNPNFAKLSSLVKSDAAWETGAYVTCLAAWETGAYVTCLAA